jgi:hypothetical protein
VLLITALLKRRSSCSCDSLERKSTFGSVLTPFGFNLANVYFRWAAIATPSISLPARENYANEYANFGEIHLLQR